MKKMKYFLLLFLFGVAWTDDTVTKGQFVHLDPTVSTHISPFLHSTLKLGPGDLKLFTGRAMNMVKTKCPSVDPSKLFVLQKYIGKVIAVAKEQEKKEKVEEVKIKSPFMQLLDSMLTCARSKDDGGDDVEMVKNFRKNLVDKPFGGITFIVRSPNGDLSLVRNMDNNDKKEESKVKSETAGVLGFQEDESDDGLLDFLSGVDVHLKDGQSTTQSPSPDKKSKTDTLKEWATSVLDKVSSFFSGIFGPGRVRRSSELLPIKKNEDGKWIHLDKVKGKEAVHKLMDQMCRLFCATCRSPMQIHNFKMAAKELTDFIVNDDNILIVASHALDEPLLESIKNCGPRADFVKFTRQ